LQEEKKRGVHFPRYNKGQAAIERHLAMVCEIQTDSCLTSQTGTAKIPQTHGRRKGTVAPLPRQTPPLRGTPPAPSDESEGTQSSETEGVPPEYL